MMCFSSSCELHIMAPAQHDVLFLWVAYNNQRNKMCFTYFLWVGYNGISAAWRAFLLLMSCRQSYQCNRMCFSSSCKLHTMVPAQHKWPFKFLWATYNDTTASRCAFLVLVCCIQWYQRRMTCFSSSCDLHTMAPLQHDVLFPVLVSCIQWYQRSINGLLSSCAAWRAFLGLANYIQWYQCNMTCFSSPVLMLYTMVTAQHDVLF